MLGTAPHKELVIHLFEATFATLVAMIRVVILFTPLGVASLVARSIALSPGRTLPYAAHLAARRFGVRRASARHTACGERPWLEQRRRV